MTRPWVRLLLVGACILVAAARGAQASRAPSKEDGLRSFLAMNQTASSAGRTRALQGRVPSTGRQKSAISPHSATIARTLATVADVQCTIFADNVLEYVYVDGVLLHENAVEGKDDSDDPGSHDGETLTLTFSSSSTSMVIKAWDWEGGCGSGGVNIECRSTAGDTAWDNIDIGIDGRGSDIPNWRVYSAESYPFEAPAGMIEGDLLDGVLIPASASSYRNALCGGGGFWVFRRTLNASPPAPAPPSPSGGSPTHSLALPLSLSLALPLALPLSLSLSTAHQLRRVLLSPTSKLAKLCYGLRLA
jgi:hypothetical protein